jgi:hypothetical protein
MSEIINDSFQPHQTKKGITKQTTIGAMLSIQTITIMTLQIPPNDH